MAPLREKNANAQANTSPNTSRKRKSDASNQDEEAPAPKPAPKRARKAAPAKDSAETPAVAKDPTKTKDSAPTEPEKPEPKSKPTKKAAAAKDKAKDTDKYDITGIALDGESTGTVPVYDTCSDIRTKITAHFKNAPKPHNSQAALVRSFQTSFPPHLTPDQGLSTRSLQTFLRQKGPNGGASTPIFYAAYVYFEKLRVKQDKKKSKKREEMEKSWGKGGFNLSNDSNQRILMHQDDRVTGDKYGHLEIVHKSQVGLGGW